MRTREVDVGSSRKPSFALAKIELRVVSVLGLLKTFRKSRVGDRGQLSSAIRTGDLILRLVDEGGRSDAARAMDIVDTVELLAQHWLDGIHRIINEATDV